MRKISSRPRRLARQRSQSACAQAFPCREGYSLLFGSTCLTFACTSRWWFCADPSTFARPSTLFGRPFLFFVCSTRALSGSLVRFFVGRAPGEIWRACARWPGPFVDSRPSDTGGTRRSPTETNRLRSLCGRCARTEACTWVLRHGTLGISCSGGHSRRSVYHPSVYASVCRFGAAVPSRCERLTILF